MVAEARAVRRRMLDDAEQRRGALVAELERVRSAIDAAIAALSELAAPAAPAGGAAPPRGEAPPSGPPPTSAPPRVEALFDSLRVTPPPVSKQPRPSRSPAEPAPSPDVAPARAPARPADLEAKPSNDTSGGRGAPDALVAGAGDDTDPGAPKPVPESPLDAIRRRRDALLEPLVPDVVRASKRLLQDEQNSLLDAVRRARGRQEPSRVLPDPVRQRETWSALLSRAIDAAYIGGRGAAGKRGRVTSAPNRLVVELSALLVAPLRERVTATIDTVLAEGPYQSPNELQRALGTAIAARFREWRSAYLETYVLDVLAAAYARGAYDAAAPAAMLRWIPDEPGRCPDCDDNGLEPTLKGKAFPTGQAHPPAHPGCRCVVVPADSIASRSAGGDTPPAAVRSDGDTRASTTAH